ncbi:MAG: hypothetical protein JST62_09095 [Bacteroidetes bacterium]|nr:hypothetical protein [Bacteroidota bacterium]
MERLKIGHTNKTTANNCICKSRARQCNLSLTNVSTSVRAGHPIFSFCA